MYSILNPLKSIGYENKNVYRKIILLRMYEQYVSTPII